MYHYIRDFSNTDFPKINGLDIRKFEFQINYLKKNFNIINPQEVHEIVLNKKIFNKRDCWLTFDDGYIDHYIYALPILESNKIKATFFPPVKTTLNKTVLDVNKIHFIIASTSDHESILKKIYNYYNLYKTSSDKSFNTIVSKIKIKSRYDSKNVELIKRLLQFGFSKKLKKKICNLLFKEYVNSDEKIFSKKLYMNISQLNKIYRLGHEIGIHGYDHIWLEYLKKKDQSIEIRKAIEFWKQKKLIKKNFSISYPYGSYNKSTIDLMNYFKCNIAVTSKPRAVSNKNYKKYELPRFDTNDFPQS